MKWARHKANTTESYIWIWYSLFISKICISVKKKLEASQEKEGKLMNSGPDELQGGDFDFSRYVGLTQPFLLK